MVLVTYFVRIENRCLYYFGIQFSRKCCGDQEENLEQIHILCYAIIVILC
jgi:hypothetical protein